MGSTCSSQGREEGCMQDIGGQVSRKDATRNALAWVEE
jgi:hypothetical protein